MISKKATYSIPSILAMFAAIGSFMSGAFLGMLLAIFAFIFGVLGIVLALAPDTRGGFLSIMAVVLSFIGVLAAMIKCIAWLLTLG